MTLEARTSSHTLNCLNWEFDIDSSVRTKRPFSSITDIGNVDEFLQACSEVCSYSESDLYLHDQDLDALVHYTEYEVADTDDWTFKSSIACMPLVSMSESCSTDSEDSYSRCLNNSN
jgi:hypothetical protein